ncbi:MAG: hypothetical protein CSA72_09015 [Rhodobacterales bacterium]|nr:MAG: hypothetical protein CSA72_09015 [Rhodobacterales bacterium]
MLELEHDELDHAIEHYEAFLKGSRLDGREAHDRDEYAVARLNADLAHSFDEPVHEHQAKIELIEHTDFGPKTEVERGAAVKFNGRRFLVVTSTRRFTVDGKEVMGISMDSPVFKAMKGLSAGDSFTLNGREITLEEVY